MGEPQHLCDPLTVLALSQMDHKRLVAGRHRKGDSFRCGGCQATFQAICVLHEHCSKHSEGGSYFFDHFTRTAFPKYDTCCEFTQVRPENIDTATGKDVRPPAVIKPNINPAAVTKINNEPVFVTKPYISLATDAVTKPNINQAAITKPNISPAAIANPNVSPAAVTVLKVEQGTEHKEIRKSRRLVKKKKFFDEDKSDNTVVGRGKQLNFNVKVEAPDVDEKKNSVHVKYGRPYTTETHVTAGSSKDNKKRIAVAESEHRNVGIYKVKNHFLNRQNNEKNDTGSIKQPVVSKTFSPQTCKIIPKKRKIDFEAFNVTDIKVIKDVKLVIDEKASTDLDSDSVFKLKEDDFTKSTKQSSFQNLYQTSVATDVEMKGENEPDLPHFAMSKDEHVKEESKLEQNSEIRRKKARQRKKIQTIDKKSSESTKNEIEEVKQRKKVKKENDGDLDQSGKRVRRLKTEDSTQYECSTCGKVGSNAMITYHKYLHMEKKSFTCDKCGMLFQHPRSLQIHMRQHGEKQFKCDKCSAAFYRKQYLETHMLKHTGENPFMCDTCGKAYRDPNHLKRHIRHVHEQVRKFECDICQEKFFRSDHLKNHRLRHSEADKKCPSCTRLFKHPDDLLRHTKTHTGEKHWFCHLCNHGFVAVNPYYIHMEKKHDIQREEAKIWKTKLRAKLKNNPQNQDLGLMSVIPPPQDEDTMPTDLSLPKMKENTSHSPTGVDQNQADIIVSNISTFTQTNNSIVSIVHNEQDEGQILDMTMEILKNPSSVEVEGAGEMEDGGTMKEACSQTGNYEQNLSSPQIQYETVEVGSKQVKDNSVSSPVHSEKADDEDDQGEHLVPRTFIETNYSDTGQQFTDESLLEESLGLHTGKYRVVQTINIDGSTVQVVHPIEKDTGEETDMVTGDLQIAEHVEEQGTDQSLEQDPETTEGEATRMSIDDSENGNMVNRQELALNEPGTELVMDDGTKVGMIMRVGDEMDGVDNMQTLLFIDNTSTACAGEVVIEHLNTMENNP